MFDDYIDISFGILTCNNELNYIQGSETLVNTYLHTLRSTGMTNKKFKGNLLNC